MNDSRSRTQAFSQAPWRKQIQVMVAFMTVLVFLALIASVYLYVSSQAVAAGLEAQELHKAIDQARLTIEDYESQLARITSAKVMAERAEALGYHPVEPDRILYVEVPGYSPRQLEVAPPAKPAVLPSVAETPPEYRQSLLEWFKDNILARSGWVTEVEP